MINFFEADALSISSTIKDKMSSFGNTMSNLGDKVSKSSKELKNTKFYSYAMKGLEILKKNFLLASTIGFNYKTFMDKFYSYQEYSGKALSGELFGNIFKEISKTVNVSVSLNPVSTVNDILKVIWGIFSFPARLLGAIAGWCAKVFSGFTTGGYSGLDFSFSLAIACVLCALALLAIYKVLKYLYAKWKKRNIKDKLR